MQPALPWVLPPPPQPTQRRLLHTAIRCSLALPTLWARQAVAPTQHTLVVGRGRMGPLVAPISPLHTPLGWVHPLPHWVVTPPTPLLIKGPARTLRRHQRAGAQPTVAVGGTLVQPQVCPQVWLLAWPPPWQRTPPLAGRRPTQGAAAHTLGAAAHTQGAAARIPVGVVDCPLPTREPLAALLTLACDGACSHYSDQFECTYIECQSSCRLFDSSASPSSVIAWCQVGK